ncbi:MAG: 16S rRNA (cytidine(1402)-2'-O)-methyltransferase [Clostridiales bacterium]|nr:16S rRNA (cytidine(1402)-2'-O)-methyltransferase [Clostridiales bacterium]
MTNSSDLNEKNAIVKGMLYLVATPIGNMSDISSRALKVLENVDFIAAEDTRNTGLLLSRLGLKKQLVSYYEQNKKESGPKIIEKLKSGFSCALVTDAGMPGISDPGADLVRLCETHSIPVTCVPGACAAVTALSISGLDTGRFVFEGFLPVKTKERNSVLEMDAKEKGSIIIYEAPHRLKKTLADLLNKFGNRKIAICRELTKLNEEVIRTSLSEAVEIYEITEPKGEFVLVVEGSQEKDSNDWSNMSIQEHVDFYMNLGDDKMSAMKKVAKDRGIGKSEIYSAMLKNN